MSPRNGSERRTAAALGRRTYLAVAAAVAASTAGCPALDGDSTDDSTPTDSDRRTAETASETLTDESELATDRQRTLLDSLATGHLLAVAEGVETVTLPTSGSATPVQDALDAVAEHGGGRVYLPPGVTRERGPVRPRPRTGLHGFGMNVSVLRITGANADGIRFDGVPRGNWVELDGFELRGPGADGPTGVALHFVDNGSDPVTDPADLHVGRLYCRQWLNSVYRVDEGVGPFQCRHDYLRADDCDAGDARALVDWRSTYGPANRFGTVVSYPTDRASGAATQILSQRGGELTVGDISVGGTAGRMLDKRAGRLRVGRLHYEPERQPSVPDSLVRVGGLGQTCIDDVIADAGTVGSVYELHDGAGDAVFHRPTTARATVRDSLVTVSGQLHPDRRSWYFGRTDDVAVTADIRTGSLRVLGAAGRGMG